MTMKEPTDLKKDFPRRLKSPPASVSTLPCSGAVHAVCVAITSYSCFISLKEGFKPPEIKNEIF